MVSDVSATLVATTQRRVPAGGGLKTCATVGRMSGPVGWTLTALGAKHSPHLGLLLWCQQRVQREDVKRDGWVGLLLCSQNTEQYHHVIRALEPSSVTQIKPCSGLASTGRIISNFQVGALPLIFLVSDPRLSVFISFIHWESRVVIQVNPGKRLEQRKHLQSERLMLSHRNLFCGSKGNKLKNKNNLQSSDLPSVV